MIKATKKWMQYYNEKRIKHKLKGRTPIGYRNLVLEKIV
ncbi:IS3 family transposase [Limosilactobacillus vaginalis]